MKVSGNLIAKFYSVKGGLTYRHLFIYEQKKHYRAILYKSETIGWKNPLNIIRDISVDKMSSIDSIFALMKLNKDEYKRDNR